jgi:hypothetical protein
MFGQAVDKRQIKRQIKLLYMYRAFRAKLQEKVLDNTMKINTNQ